MIMYIMSHSLGGCLLPGKHSDKLIERTSIHIYICGKHIGVGMGGGAPPPTKRKYSAIFQCLCAAFGPSRACRARAWAIGLGLGLGLGDGM